MVTVAPEGRASPVMATVNVKIGAGIASSKASRRQMGHERHDGRVQGSA